MLHIAKLAVGIRDINHLAAWQAERGRIDPPLRHRTRNMPRRAAEIIGAGSIYWVIAGTMLVRQRVLDIIEDRWDDGRTCAGLVLDPSLVQVEGRPVKAFQGWRYLEEREAPADVSLSAADADEMPPALRNELRALCLI
ncbi:MAG: DUF1489 family protein [Janthinobacterium lividum]